MSNPAKRKIFIALHHLGERGVPFFRRLEEAGFDIVRNPHKRYPTEDEMIGLVPGIFATVAGVEPYTERVLQAATELRIVARFGVGYDKIDVPAATRHGVAIAMAFGANHEAVADTAFTLMAAIMGKTLPHHQRIKGGGWGQQPHPGLWRATVGIIGLGRTGKAMARRCLGFEMRILAHEVQPDVEFVRRHGVELVSLEMLLREADVVSLHAPHTPETDRLMSEERLALMKPTAYLVNTARGGLVDEEALYRALTAGRLAGAALDVFRQEPPAGSPLLQLDNVLLSPHCAGTNLTSERNVASRCVDSILEFTRGQGPDPQYLLNPEVLRSGCRAVSGQER